MQVRSWIAMAAFLSVSAACGGATEDHAQPSGSGGAGGSAGSSGGAASGGSAGVGGSGGSGAAECLRTDDHADVVVRLADGGTVDCTTADWPPGEPAPEPSVLAGAVTRIDATGFELETCPPNADCAASIVRIDVSSPGIEIDLPVGAFVRVTYLFTRFWTCQQALEVRSLAEWGGVENPMGLGEDLLLAVVDGGGPFEDSPYEIDRVALGCAPDAEGCGSVPPDEYALVLSTPLATGSFEIVMGETVEIPIETPSPSRWRVRNLRSYQTEYCDDYWNFAYTITR